MHHLSLGIVSHPTSVAKSCLKLTSAQKRSVIFRNPAFEGDAPVVIEKDEYVSRPQNFLRITEN